MMNTRPDEITNRASEVESTGARVTVLPLNSRLETNKEEEKATRDI